MEHEHIETAQEVSTPARISIFSGASPKLTFVLGIVTGVAVVSLVGFVTAGIFAFSGKLNTGKTPTPAVANQPVAEQPQQPQLGNADITLKPTDYILGDANAPVTIVTYSDLECPYCKQFHSAVAQSLKDFPGKVKWVYRHFPLSFHANAEKEAEAAACVGKLSGAATYWKFIDAVYQRTTSNGTGFALTALAPLAKELGVSESRFNTCLDQGETASLVQTDLQEGSAYGVQGTPTSFVNGAPVEGAVPYAQFKTVIDQALAEVK